MAYIDDDGQDYYDALHNALYPPANLTSISCVYTQSGAVYDTDTLDSLKSDLVVTAHYSNGTTQTVTSYTLSGTLTTGTSTITVSYGGKTTTFNVAVSQILYPLETGTMLFDNGRQVSVYNGNIVKGELIGSVTTDIKANISQVSLNNSSDSNSINNNKVGTKKLFTISTGSIVSISVTPLTLEYNASIGSKQTNLAARGQDGVATFTILDTTTYSSLVVGTPVTKTFTAESDVDIWNITIFLGSNSLTQAIIEYKIELSVDGVRYI
mgnify:CR=1 FL=1